MVKRALAALTLSVAMAGCTLTPQTLPALTGPSEFGVSIAMTASPDVLVQNGAAQSIIEVLVRDANSQPLAGQSFFIRSRFGTSSNPGTLSASTLSTNSQGRASAVFTAPDAGEGAWDFVEIFLTPVGTNADNTVTRVVSIRMLRP